ncbi:N-6 DNA methylase [Flavobacterium columnare]|uniref:N-6 DNA methylase n=1 Tax=Flavobacterium columnare TaxID=996 RepID=UPI002D208B49|nr:N-6 DNA methylase [Flavobacterium columnare]MEB3800790.1 N-6 DNA methylase [Flavobacterium columnare]
MNSLFEIELTKEDNLLKKFEEIHNYIYANDGLSPQQTLEEFVKILFIKIYDENRNLNQFNISAEEWNEMKTGKTTLSINERINNLFEETKKAYQDIFDSDDRIRISTIALGFTINKIQSISLLNSSQDAKGLAFQKFLSHHEKDGRGQFFTPEPVIDFCVEMMQPKPTEKIIDPACGSGGFLMSALKYLQKNYSELDTKSIVSENIYGADINKSIARIAKMKLLLEANGKTNVLCTNTLEDLDSLKLSLSNTTGFDLVLANPPFGAKITNTSTLSKFDLGHKWANQNNEYHKTKSVYPNQNAEILFIERCLQLLNEGGRLAIVLPNGNFENPSLEYLRYYIKLKAKILAIVNLPQETFIPFGTGVKTSLLFLQKDTPNLVKEYPIFFGRVTKLGYQGNKNGTPTYKKDKFGQIIKDKFGQPILDEDFSEIVDAYKKFQKGNQVEQENSFSINYNELNGRFDFDFYSPENRKMFSILDKTKTVRLGDICDIIKVKSRKLKDQNQTVEYVELSDINTHSYEIINSTTLKVHELPSRASYEIEDGDIITAIAGNSVGTRKHATALVNKDFEGSICTNGFRVLRNIKIDNYYLLYFLKSEVFLKQMFMYRTGAAIPNVSDTDLANTLINLPDEKMIAEISSKMKKSFELRQESRQQIESINFEFA